MLWINMPALPVGRDAVRRRQGFGLRLRRRPEALEAYLNTRAVSIMNV